MVVFEWLVAFWRARFEVLAIDTISESFWFLPRISGWSLLAASWKQIWWWRRGRQPQVPGAGEAVRQRRNGDKRDKSGIKRDERSPNQVTRLHGSPFIFMALPLAALLLVILI